VTPPRVLAYDLMDTLLRDPYREALEAGAGMPLEELARRRGSGWSAWPAFERGEIDEDEYWATHARAGIAFDVEAFHRVRRAGYAWIDGMPELVAALAGRVRQVVASNYPVWIEEVAAHHLGDRFEVVIASHHVGVRKPEQGFYAALIEELGATPADVLFVDDREVNVTAAREAGLRSHLFTGAEDLRTRLAAEGLEA
jgi:HAD superfamily hydrolase (TIGR01509 family)